MNQERGASSAPQSGAPLAATLPEAVTFRELGLPEPLLRAVDTLGFERCIKPQHFFYIVGLEMEIPPNCGIIKTKFWFFSF